MSGSPARSLSLAPEERHRILHEWNDTTREYPRDLSLHQVFDAQAQRTPEAIAVVRGRERVTYRQLGASADAMSRRLRRRGVRRDTLVAICPDRSIAMVAGLLGILKAGGAYVPLDPTYPRERVEFMLRDAGARVVLTQERFRSVFEGAGRDVIPLEAGSWESDDATEDLGGEANAGDLAYVIYTSGSTGRPKGVAIEHRSAVNLVCWAREIYGERELSGVFASTSICFDLSVFELFVPLSWGGTIVLGENALELPMLAASSEVVLVNTVPSAMTEVLRLGLPPSVKTVNLAGEPLSPELVRRLHRQGVERVFDLYGPSESTTYSTYVLRDPDGPATIGRPIANTQIYILSDARMDPVPVGEVGEIHVGGDGLARGYLNRPELTEERFLSNPFGPGRLYRTGDLGRYLPDGNIQFLGRRDYQVKLRGYRIELGEIESVLSAHPRIRERVVVAREEASGSRRLVAYFVSEPGETLSVRELREFLKRSLPEYMIPSVFVALSALPRTPNGKVDRKALPEPSQERPDLETPYVHPRDEVERWLAGIWREVLLLDRVGVHDRFFELGGDSIQGAELINRVKEALDESVYIVALFEAPTVGEFASYLAKHYPKALSERFGGQSRVKPARHAHAEDPFSRTVDAAMASEFRRLVPGLPPRAEASDPEPKNPRAIFILAAPRSGTTLLRVMLAGHPRLFAAAELQLLSFDTLSERRAAFAGKYALWLEGVYRALMEIRGCDAEEAKGFMEEQEGRNLTTKAFYRLLQEEIGERVLVDKSPSYVLDLETLRRSEDTFERPLFIHLVREPHAMVRSFESFHLDQVFFPRAHPFSPRQLAELVWLVGNENVLRFLEGVSPERQYRMRFEELVTRPHSVMEEMCGTLGLEFVPELLRPYEGAEKKMTDGIYPASMPMGDTRFHSYRDIDPSVLGKWRETSEENFLGTPTRELAERLGYDTPPKSGTGRGGRAGARDLQEQRRRRSLHRAGAPGAPHA